ncbi:MAG: NUDIX domain-containing protein [archaeon]
MMRQGISAVIVLEGQRVPKFLILHRKLNWVGWELLKGGMLENETELECLRREIKEETGLSKDEYRVYETPYFYEFKYPKPIPKDGSYYEGARHHVFIVFTNKKKIKICDEEHDDYSWVTAQEALEKLTHENQKEALKYVLNNFFEQS